MTNLLKKILAYFLSFILIFIFFSCRNIKLCGEKLDMYLVKINQHMNRRIIDDFVEGNNEYIIKDNIIYCCNLNSKIKLKKMLVFCDRYFFNYFVVVNYKINPDEKNNSEIRIVIESPQEMLKDAKYDDNFITVNNFVYPEDLDSLSSYIVDEEAYSTLKLETILSYFNDNCLELGVSNIYNNLNTNFGTIIAFLIDNGYFVEMGDETPSLFIKAE